MRPALIIAALACFVSAAAAPGVAGLVDSTALGLLMLALLVVR